MLREDNIKYRQIRPNMTGENLQKLASNMKEGNQTALTVDMERLSKKDLSFLAYFDHITHLGIIGASHKQIEKIQILNNIVDLCLMSVKVSDYSFLLPMKKLSILDIRFGSAKNFSLLGKLDNIKALCFLRINKLNDVTFLSNMSNLQYIKINSCRNVVTFPNLTNLNKLRRVHLETMNGLINIDGISKAPNLEELIVIQAKSLEPDNFNCFVDHLVLKKVLPEIGTFNSKRYKDTCDMFSGRVMDGFYGTKNTNFHLV